jgi:hypothetical protein
LFFRDTDGNVPEIYAEIESFDPTWLEASTASL